MLTEAISSEERMIFITRYSSDDPSFPKSCDNLASFDEQLMITYIGDLQIAA